MRSMTIPFFFFASVLFAQDEQTAPVVSNTRLIVSLQKSFIEDEIKNLKEDFPEEDAKQLEEEGRLNYTLALRNSFMLQGALWKQAENDSLTFYVELPKNTTELKFQSGLRDIVSVETPVDNLPNVSFEVVISEENKKNTPSELQHLLGLPVLEALELIQNSYNSCRVVKIDDNNLVKTADFRDDRVEVEIINGRVVKATIG